MVPPTSVRKVKKKSTDNEDVNTQKPEQRKQISKNEAPSTSKTKNSVQSKDLSARKTQIVKTKYFPSKNLYSNALKTNSEMKEVKATKKVIAKPQKIATSSDNQKENARPRTATLKRGSIVNSNIIGPEAPKTLISEPKKEDTDTDSYENSFESYESDFENDSSLENLNSSSTTTSNYSLNEPIANIEEKKLDSGTFELPDSKQYIKQLDNITEKIEPTQKCVSLTDEGFEESSLQPESLQCLNFKAARKQINTQNNLRKNQLRGNEILSMIKLDYYNFTFFEFPPMTYNEFIDRFGRKNTLQVAVQTGDDNIDESIQTDSIDKGDKWTQFPTKFSKVIEPHKFKEELLGVGGDNTVIVPQNDKFYNEKRLEKFLLRIGKIFLNIFEEKAEIPFETTKKHEEESIFSKAFIAFDNKFSILENKPINYISFDENSSKILSVHGNCDLNPKSEDLECVKSIICLWNVAEPKMPKILLVSPTEIKCCNFVSANVPFVIGGSNNGLLLAWNLNQNCQKRVSLYKSDKTGETFIQKPTILSDVGVGHQSIIISIKVLLSISNNVKNDQIYSLDEDGILISWGINIDEKDLCRQISLIQTKKVILNQTYQLENLKCTDMSINKLDISSILISTNYGSILHLLTNGAKQKPSKFYSDSTSQANCIHSCSFSPLYFLAGYDDGTISLYSRLHEKPLMIMANRDCDFMSGIQCVQWSYTKPCIFYVKDSNSTIHIWNLAINDLIPIYSIQLRKPISYMKLVDPVRNQSDNDFSYMILADDNGLIYLHLLNSEHYCDSTKPENNDIKVFLNYVNRL